LSFGLFGSGIHFLRISRITFFTRASGDEAGGADLRVVEERTKLRGADLFYVDDRAENIQGRGARVAGGHHVSPAQTLEIARSVGL